MKKRFFSLLLALLLTFSLTAPALATTQFSDIASHWGKPEIQRAADSGILQGYPDGSFRPENMVTHAEWFTILTRKFYAADLEACAYLKTEYSRWWADALMAATWRGLTRSTAFYADSSTSFYLNDQEAGRSVDRFSMANSLMYLLESLEGKSADELFTQELYAQANAALSDYAAMTPAQQKAVALCYDRNLIRGTTKGIFDGGSTMTRAQAATVLSRLMDYELAQSKAAKLANGKPITDENIQEILAQLKQEIPEGTFWTNEDNEYFFKAGYSRGFGCAAFAFLLSDRIFGLDAPLHKLEKASELRLGDYLYLNPGSFQHFVVVTGFSEDGQTYYASSGNVVINGQGIVVWSHEYVSSHKGTLIQLQTALNEGRTIAYSRYPK